LQILFIEHTAQTLAIAIHFEGFAGENFNLEILFLLLLGQMDDLSGKPGFGFGIRRDVFELGGVGEGGKVGDQQTGDRANA